MKNRLICIWNGEMQYNFRDAELRYREKTGSVLCANNTRDRISTLAPKDKYFVIDFRSDNLEVSVRKLAAMNPVQ